LPALPVEAFPDRRKLGGYLQPIGLVVKAIAAPRSKLESLIQVCKYHQQKPARRRQPDHAAPDH
jgi:hypothetical protein